MKKYSFFLFFLFLTPLLTAQQEISLENIWRDYTFYPKSVPGFNFLKDGKHYTRLEEDRINQYSLASGEKVKVLFNPDLAQGNQAFAGEVDGYTFSANESKILIKTENEKIYRRSSRGNFFIYDRDKSSMTTLSDNGKQQYATFSPAADKMAAPFPRRVTIS
jgi:dipeptidyl-peptidase-4